MKRFLEMIDAFGESDIFTAAAVLAFVLGSAAFYIGLLS